MNHRHYDVISLGRVSMDLFAREIGAPFEQIENFETGVGGSPTNIALGSSRLGLQVGLATAVGDDEVGKFVFRYLSDNRVDTQFVQTKAGKRTGMAVVGVQPPDRFPLLFYREDPADMYLSIDDVRSVPIAESATLVVTGNAFSRGTCRDAALYAVEVAAGAGTRVFLDLDLRPDQWSHPLAYGTNIRSVLPMMDVVIGTEEEFYAALAPDPVTAMAGTRLNARQLDELESLLRQRLQRARDSSVFVVKRGASGAACLRPACPDLTVPGFPVDILNTVGAGDAFASGLLYGHCQGWDWPQAIRMGNACGALVVTRHGCGTAMPTLDEAFAFIQQRGGF